MLAELLARQIDDIAARIRFRTQFLDEARIVAVGDEADVLAVRLGRDAQTQFGSDLTHPRLRERAEREAADTVARAQSFPTQRLCGRNEASSGSPELLHRPNVLGLHRVFRLGCRCRLFGPQTKEVVSYRKPLSGGLKMPSASADARHSLTLTLIR